MNEQLTRDKQVHLTQSGFRLLGLWDIPKHLHPELLGLSDNMPKRKVNRYRLGSPLPAVAFFTPQKAGNWTQSD